MRVQYCYCDYERDALDKGKLERTANARNYRIVNPHMPGLHAFSSWTQSRIDVGEGQQPISPVQQRYERKKAITHGLRTPLSFNPQSPHLGAVGSFLM